MKGTRWEKRITDKGVAKASGYEKERPPERSG